MKYLIKHQINLQHVFMLFLDNRKDYSQVSLVHSPQINFHDPFKGPVIIYDGIMKTVRQVKITLVNNKKGAWVFSTNYDP